MNSTNDTTSQRYWQAHSLNGAFHRRAIKCLVERDESNERLKCCLECCFLNNTRKRIANCDDSRFGQTQRMRLERENGASHFGIILAEFASAPGAYRATSPTWYNQRSHAFAEVL